jgi:TnpA family transposase
VNFGLFDLVGKSLTPRIRDLGKMTLVRGDSPAATNALYPHAGPLLADRWNEDLVADCWGDLLRMGGSLKFGEATASLIVGKWSAASRQNTLASALKEWGRMRRTIHAARYLSDPVYRRKISRQLNKANRCTRCAVTCTTPSRAPSSAPTSRTRPNRPGASPCSRTR